MCVFFDFFFQIVLGLCYIYKEKYIVYRDFILNNIMLGENDKVMISKIMVIVLNVVILFFGRIWLILCIVGVVFS